MTSNHTRKGIKGFLSRWKQYIQITELGDIMRRYFVMNCFDGVLTVLGLIIANFLLYLSGHYLPSNLIIVPGLTTTLAIGVSGIAGASITESAERRRTHIELKKAMMLPLDEDEINHSDKNNVKLEFKEEDYYPTVLLDEEKASMIDGEVIEHVEVDPLPYNLSQVDVSNKNMSEGNSVKNNIRSLNEKTDKKKGENNDEKDITEKAQRFASIVAGLIDGVSPAIGSLIGLIPFFFVTIPTAAIFLTSLSLETVILFGLGAFLAHISQERIWGSGLKMILAGLLTCAVSVLISRF